MALDTRFVAATVSPPPNPSRSTGEAANGGMCHQQAITTPSTTCSDGAFILHRPSLPCAKRHLVTGHGAGYSFTDKCTRYAVHRQFYTHSIYS